MTTPLNYELKSPFDGQLASQDVYNVRIQKTSANLTAYDATHKQYVDSRDAAEAAARISADAAEVVARNDAIATAVSNEATIRAAGDLAEAAARSAAIDSAIATEVAAREAALAESKLYSDTAIAALVNGAPSTLDTLKELADYLTASGASVGLVQQLEAIRADFLAGDTSVRADLAAALSAAVAAEASTRQTAIEAEALSRSTADAAEVVARDGAINAAKSQILLQLSDERVQRATEDAAINNALSSEIQGRENAFNSLEGRKFDKSGGSITGDVSLRLADESSPKFLYFSDNWRLSGSSDGTKLIFWHRLDMSSPWKAAIPFIRSIPEPAQAEGSDSGSGGSIDGGSGSGGSGSGDGSGSSSGDGGGSGPELPPPEDITFAPPPPA